MANFLKFRITEKVGDKQFGLGGLGAFRAGQIVTCTSEQAHKWIKTRDIADGFIEPIGENNGEEWSKNIRSYIDGVPGFKGNTLPVSEVVLTANTTPDTQGIDLAGSLTLDRRVAVDKFLVNHTTASGGNLVPIILASAGNPVTTDAINVIAYDNSLGTYHLQANNTIAAAITGSTAWAADDLVIIGCTEKFSSVIWTIGTAAIAGSVFTATYWNGTDWIDFPETTELTLEAGTGGALGRTDDNTRTIWWEKPINWRPGGPVNSGCVDAAYYVALRTNGALTSLAGAIPRPCLDSPLGVIRLGLHTKDVDAMVSLIDNNVVDVTKTTAVLTGMDATGDYIYVASDQLFRGVAVNMDGTNVNAEPSVLSAAYWNGRTWNAINVTDGTSTGADASATTLSQDGNITIDNLPFDWVPVAADANLGFIPPSTLTDEKLYWLRFAINADITESTAIANVWALPPIETWYEFNAYPNSFVEAGEPFKLFVNDEDATIAGVVVKVIVMDV